MITPIDIDAAREAIERMEREYLREKAWKYTCDVPGSFWLWEKTLPDGRLVLLDTSLAISVQEAMDGKSEEQEEVEE